MSKISKLVGRFKSKEFVEYISSTHFWGPVANWLIPCASIADFKKDPSMISANTTAGELKLASDFSKSDK